MTHKLLDSVYHSSSFPHGCAYEYVCGCWQWPQSGAEVDWVVRQRARTSLSGKRGPRWKCGRGMWPRRGRCALAAITACCTCRGAPDSCASLPTRSVSSQPCGHVFILCTPVLIALLLRCLAHLVLLEGRAHAVRGASAGNMLCPAQLYDAAIVANGSHAAAWHGWGLLEKRQGNPLRARDLWMKVGSFLLACTALRQVQSLC